MGPHDTGALARQGAHGPRAAAPGLLAGALDLERSGSPLADDEAVAIARLQPQHLRLVDQEGTGLAARVADLCPRRQGLLLLLAQPVVDRPTALILDHEANLQRL